jgi:hypothetical protein
MPVVMSMEWDGVTPEQYDEAREKAAWETDVPDGAILHVPWFVDDGIRVTDVWETGEHFQQFVDRRLMPAVREIGIQGEPRVDIRPLHSHVFAPALEKATTG